MLRLLRGEPLEELSRELEVEAHRRAAWRDDFLEHGKQGLESPAVQRGDPGERRLRRAERKVGEFTLENEILRYAAKGAEDPAAEAAAIAVERAMPLKRVCDVLGAPRSRVYHRRRRAAGNVVALRPGPCGDIDDDRLAAAIRQVIAASPFTGEGYRKVRARLRRTRHPCGRHAGVAAAPQRAAGPAAQPWPPQPAHMTARSFPTGRM